MSAFNNILKSDTPTVSNSNARTDNLSGQGSHFGTRDHEASYPTTADLTGTTLPTAYPPTAGHRDISQARGTTGPEAGGSDHVGTLSSGNMQDPHAYHTSLPSETRSSGAAQNQVGASGLTSSAPFTPASAASSAHNRSGNMPGAFPGSDNPYRATHPLDPRVDGGKASDPVASYPTTAASTYDRTGTTAATTHDRTATTAGGTGVGTATGASALGSSQATRHDTSTTTPANTSTVPAPSSLTTTNDPATRSSDYSRSVDDKGLDMAAAGNTAGNTTGYTSGNTTGYTTGNTTGNTATSTATSTTTHPEHGEDTSTVNKVLEAVGLTGAVAAASAALGLGPKDGTPQQPRETSAIAAQPGELSQEMGPPKHYRRESIPTTAYPAGPNSPRAIAPPIGGTRTSISETGDSSHLGRDAGIASGAGAGAAGGAIAAHEFDRSRAPHDSTIGQTGSAGVARENVPTFSVHDHVTSPRNVDSQGHTGRDIATGGAAASAAGAGAYGLHEHNREEPVSSTTTAGSTAPPVHAAYQDSRQHTGRDIAAGGAAATAVGAGAYGLHEHNKQEPVSSAMAGSTNLPIRSADKNTYTIGNEKGRSPIDAVAAAPNRYEDQAAVPPTATARQDTTEKSATAPTTTAAAAGLGAAGAGAGIAAVHGHDKQADIANQRLIERDEKKHQKELEREEKHHQKELEKEQKQHQKEVEKEEKHHQKEIEKEEKAQAREMEKERKEHDKAAAAAEERERARLASEEEDRKRKEREAAAVGTGAVGAGAAGTALEKRTSPTSEEGEKKPSIFKRIGRKIMRRKNKDTGEDEDYSTDEDETKPRRSLEPRRSAEPRRSVEHGSGVPTHESASKGRTVLGPSYEEASGGAQKPSYNPFTKDKPATTGTDFGSSTAGRVHDTEPRGNVAGGIGGEETRDFGATGAGTGTHGTGTGLGATSGTHHGASISTDPNVFTRPIDDRTGLAYDPTKDTDAAGRLGYSGTGPEKPTENYTGLAYDPSKDPDTARRISERAGHSEI